VFIWTLFDMRRFLASNSGPPALIRRPIPVISALAARPLRHPGHEPYIRTISPKSLATPGKIQQNSESGAPGPSPGEMPRIDTSGKNEAMTTIATFTTPEDAHLFRAFLASEGIEGFLRDEFTVQMFWYYSNAIGGVRVAVYDGDEKEASRVYSSYIAALRDGPYPLNPVRAWPVVSVLSLILGIPLILFGRCGLHRTESTD